MKKFLSINFAVLMLILFGGCAQGDTTREGIHNSSHFETREILSDSDFIEGVKISGLESQTYAYTWWKYDGSTATKEPFWSLGQYCNLARTRDQYNSSVNDLSLGTLLEEAKGIVGYEDGAHTLTNVSGSKLLKITPKAGKVVLIADTSKEYVDQETGAIQPRSDGEDWVHMILSGTCEVVYPASVEALMLSLDFTVDECTVFDGTIGADQFQWIFQIRDMSSSTIDYFWFNLTFFDNRFEIFPGTQSFDGGKADATGKFIYALSGRELFGESNGKIEVGATYHVELDLKEFLHTAFLAAQSNGALLQSDWTNMAVNNFNLGWEVSNVAKVGVTLKNISVSITEKQEVSG